MKFYTNFKVQVIVFIILFSASSVMADSITKPYTFSAGTSASSSEVNANFDTVYEQVNKIGGVINIDSEKQRVGIGTDNPDEALAVDGSILLTGSLIVEKLSWIALNSNWDRTDSRWEYLENGPAYGIYETGDNNAWSFRRAVSGEANNSISWKHFMIVYSETGDVALAPSEGNVGVGTTNPNRKLTVDGDAGGTTAWYNDSDERLKKNVTTIENALGKVQNLRGVSFEWKDAENHPEGKQLGFIAQESKDIVPEVIDKKGEYYSMQYAPLTALLVEAVKEMKTELDDLKAENEALKAVICEEFPEKGICQ
ncbi:MAG: tail fiber domain-containing protein [Desulfobacterales bacterium]|nr:tail fiber domain-containing protein [Desulfobacterales bacterium]